MTGSLKISTLALCMSYTISQVLDSWSVSPHFTPNHGTPFDIPLRATISGCAIYIYAACPWKRSRTKYLPRDASHDLKQVAARIVDTRAHARQVLGFHQHKGGSVLVSIRDSTRIGLTMILYSHCIVFLHSGEWSEGQSELANTTG